MFSLKNEYIGKVFCSNQNIQPLKKQPLTKSGDSIRKKIKKKKKKFKNVKVPVI